MTNNAAKIFGKAYLTMASKNDARFNMTNSAIDFTARARTGEFDNISDEKYQEMLTDTEDISSFWERSQSETAGNILLNAMARTNISN